MIRRGLSPYNWGMRMRHHLASAGGPRRKVSSMFNYVGDMLKSGSINPSNPLLSDNDDDESINFSRLRPTHLVSAAQKVSSDAQEQMTTFNPDSTTPEAMMGALESIFSPLNQVNNVLALSVLIHTYDPEWIRAAEKAQPLVQSDVLQQPSYHLLQKALLASNSDGYNDPTLEQKLKVISYDFESHGLHLEGTKREQWNKVNEALVGYEKSFKWYGEEHDSNNTQPVSSTRKQLEDMYALLTLYTHKAKLNGFDNLVQSEWARRSSHHDMYHHSVDDVYQMHQELTDIATPVVRNVSAETWQEIGESDVDLSAYLTLDGTLVGLFMLCRTLFGIEIEEVPESSFQGWHPEVRLFALYESSSSSSEGDGGRRLLGKVYLDPCRRQMKSPRTVTGPISTNVCYMSCQIPPATWSDQPIFLSLDHVLDLFHEFGHVLQHLLSENKSTFLGPHNAPIEMEEFIPHFMEHWVYEPSFLQTLAQLSEASATEIPEEVMKRLHRQRALRRADWILHQCFLSELELEVFQNQRQEGESLVALQYRVANKFISHELPSKEDLTPLATVFGTMASGARPVSYYRYPMAEMMSADIFGVFQEAGLSNRTKVQQLGGVLRSLALAAGSMADHKKLYKSILGRETITSEALVSNILSKLEK